MAPVPITDFQSLIGAVIQPKVQALTSKFGAFSGFLGGGSGGAGAAATVDGSGASAGLGNVLSSLLRLSGPILQSSSGGGAAASTTDDFDADDDVDI